MFQLGFFWFLAMNLECCLQTTAEPPHEVVVNRCLQKTGSFIVSHMVIYRGADGKPGYQQAEDIHDAVTFVEQMRNEDGVEHARIFRLEEVIFEYRPYFRVELSAMGLNEPPIGAPTGPVAAVPSMSSAPSTGEITVDVTDDAGPTVQEEAFEVVEPASLGMDDLPDGDAIASNGARRGLFGR